MSGKTEQRQEGVQGSVVRFLSALGEPEGGGKRKDPIETHLQVGSSESMLVMSPGEQGIIRIVLSST